MLDPQHRLFLECAWQALEEAGHDPSRFAGPIGVFAGAGVNTYLLSNLLNNPELMTAIGSLQAMLGSGPDFLATRVSYHLGLRGPSLTVQTACSTSLVAVHLAVQSLLNGECDMALAGGARLLVPRRGGHRYQPGSIFSPDGHCRPFDAAAAGTTEGEGVGIVVLRRLADAVSDGDFIHAVILGSAINNDGSSKMGFTVPSVSGQAEVIAMAQALAGIEPGTIGLIEAHGTGTPLGDPIEVAALAQVFAGEGEPGRPCALGSVKSNLGHLDAAAGVASLIKAVLAVEHGLIPPSLHFERPNPQLDLHSTPFYVPVAAVPWLAGESRRAGVSSFGIGGTNAHVVLEQAPLPPPGNGARRRQLLVLSARTLSALEETSRNLALHLGRHPDLHLDDVAHTLQVGRVAFDHRRIVVCADTADAVEVLSNLDPKRVLSRTREPGARPVFFLFPGQGSQHPGMAAELYREAPLFRAEVDRGAEILRPRLGFDLRQILYPAEGDRDTAAERLKRTAFAQPALFVVEHALARLWMEWGIRPEGMLGHSVGEYVAACLAGVFSLEEALWLVAERGRLMEEMPGGSMLAVPLPEKEVRPLLGGLSLAAVNGPSMCVVAGESEKISELAAQLAAEGVEVRRLHTSHAFHSTAMEPVLERFAEAFKGVRLNPPEIPFLSNLSGSWIRREEATSPQYWLRHLRETVRFADGLEVLFARPSSTLLEVGPGQALTALARQHPRRPGALTVLASLPPATGGGGVGSDAAVILRALGQLWLAGAEVDWAGVQAREPRRRVPLPTYPFERQRYWVEPAVGGAEARGRVAAGEQSFDHWFWAPLWRQAFPLDGQGLTDAAGERSWLVFSDETGLGDRLVARLREGGGGVTVVRPGERFEPLGESDFVLRPGVALDYAALLDRLAERGASPERIVHLWSLGPAGDSRLPRDVGREQEMGFFSLLHLARALGERRSMAMSPGPPPLHLGVISTGLQRITGAEDLVPGRATLLGPAITIPQEYPGITCGVIDVTLPPPGSREEGLLLGLLLDELTAVAAEPIVAYRGTDRWLRDFEPRRLASPPGPLPLREGGAYLVTGGLGGVGLELAGFLAREVRAKLVLTGRAPFPPRDEWPVLASGEGRAAQIARRLLDLEAAGAEVWVAQADVTDAASMRRALGAARARFGPIRGAIHAAGVAGGGLMQWRSLAEAEAVLAPKVVGTLLLEELLAEDAPDFLILCSSLNALVGGLGQVDYTAANAFLDAFAQSRTGTLPVLSINWDAWRGVGMAAVRSEVKGAEATGAESAEVLSLQPFSHPLLHEHGMDGEGSGIFIGRIRPGESWIVDEHRLGGHPVVPGTTYLDLACAAYRDMAAASGAIELRAVQFVTPMRISDGETREFRVALHQNGDGFHQFSVRSRDGGGWQEHVVGAIGAMDAADAATPESARIDVSSFLSWEEEILGEDYRENLVQAGLGPRWEVLKRVYRRGGTAGIAGEAGELVGLLELAPEFTPDLVGFKLHPALFDAATSFAEHYVAGAEGYYLPLSYRRLQVMGPLPRRIYSHARLRPQGLQSHETLSFDITVLDETGLERIRVEEFTLKRVDVAATLRERAHRGDRPPPPPIPTAMTPQVEDLVESRMEVEQAVEAFRRILGAGPLRQIAVSVRPLPEVFERARSLTAERLAGTVRLTPGGGHARPDLTTPYVAPRGERETQLAAIWSDVLGVDRVGAFDDFFELGGHSLLGTQMMSRVRETFGIEMPLGRLFEAATVAEFAAVVSDLRQKGLGREPIPPLRRAPLRSRLPLSFAQERLWFLDQLEPGSPLYNIPAVVHLEGGLDVSALRRSLGEVARRHAALRTTFALVDGLPAQRIVAEPDLRFPVVDLAPLPAERQGVETGRLAARESSRPFDLGRGPLLRAALLRLSPHRHTALFTLHHIVADDWSTGVLVREMAALYRAFREGLPSPLPELPIQSADYALWQREWLSGEVLEEQLGYWLERLSGAPGALDLSTDRPRPLQQSFRGATLVSPLPAGLSAAVEGLARRYDATPFMVFLAAFEALLYRVTGQGCLLVGSAIAGRNRREIEGLIGFFVNTLVMRADLSGETTWRELLAATKDSALGAYAHQDLPFEKLVGELVPARDPARSPLVQVLFQFQNAAAASLALPGLAISHVEAFGQTAKFDLVVNLREGEGGLTSHWQYRTDLFDSTTVMRLSNRLWRLLADAAADTVEETERRLSDLALLADEESHQLVGEWNVGTAAPVPGSLYGLFAAQAAQRPEAVAVVGGEERLSYGELERRANGLACHLETLGVRRGDRVALLLARSPRLPESILAVLQAGAAYVPLDPAYPAERLAFLLADSGARVLLTDVSLPTDLVPPPEVRVVARDPALESGEGEGGTRAFATGAAQDLAYVIYTSGSTGRPKGVGVTHANAVRLLTVTEDTFGFGPADVWTLFHSYAFDFSVWELWGALAHGGRLVVISHETSRTPSAFRDLLAQEGVTVLNQTPSAFRQLTWAEESALSRGAPELALRWVIFGGEALEPGSLEPWLARHGGVLPALVNMYGITETTVHVTSRRLLSGDLAAGNLVGRALPDLSVYLVDRDGCLAPLGTPGEIQVGGAGVSAGYLGRPELTAERFVPDPFGSAAGARLYRSGDLARWRPWGDLDYLGRIDHQVKVRGFRVELGEIESALARHPGVREVVVLASDGAAEDRRLVAYVVPESGAEPSLQELRSALGLTLPDYMLPGALVILERLPLTPNGKLDRQSLSRLRTLPLDAGGLPVAPRTALEHHLAALFAGQLKLAEVGAHDDFFALGGNSIQGAILINRLQEELGEIVHVVAIFDAPTVADLARHLAAQHPRAVARIWGRESLGEGGLSEPAEPERRIDRQQAAVLRARIRPLTPLPRPVARNRRAIFVLSPPRSGSTLLRVMLAGHPGLFAPPELELLSFTTLTERRQAFSGRDSFWLEGLTRAITEARGVGIEAAEAELAAAEEEGLLTLELYGRLQGWLGERTLVDKTPSYALDRAVLERAEEGFEAPFYIELLRHPHGMIRSFEEVRLEQIFFRQEHPFRSRELAELIWLVSHENIGEFLAGVPAERQHRVRFEELVRDPGGVLRGLCRALGLEYDPAMARPYDNPRERMTDGLHAESRMLGDVKFHEHREVEPRTAERWREGLAEDFLGEPTRQLAAALGYRQAGALLARIERRAWRPDEPRRLSFAQERLWFLERLRPGNPLYNLPMALDLRGPLDFRALAASLAGLIARHEALRTSLQLVDAHPVQVIAPPTVPVLPVVDLRSLPRTVREATVVRLAEEEKVRPFDLERGPLVRAALLRSEVDRHAALFTAHHTVADGWSMGILAREVSALYTSYRTGRPSALAELPIQYADYAAWQRDGLTGEILTAEIAWWREQLTGAPAVVDLPLDRPRPAVHRFRGERRGKILRADLIAGLEGLARRSGATRFMALLTVFEGLLSRYSGQRVLPVGTPVAGRGRAEVEPLIGLFVNTLVLAPDLSGEPGLLDLLDRVRETALGAYAHQDLPFEKLVEELAPERSSEHTPLFQVMFLLDEWELAPPEFPGLAVESLVFENRTARFDLTLIVGRGIEGSTLTLGYNSDLFRSATILRMLEHFEALLAAALADPGRAFSELSLLRAAERHQLLWDWNDTAAPEPAGEGLLHGLVREQEALRGDAVALVLGSESVSYGELDRRVARLARRLSALGVGLEARVGVCFERSFDLIVALLAVMAAGGAYVPLDPSNPRSRLADLLRDAGVSLVLGRRRLLDEVARAGIARLDLEAGDLEDARTAEADPGGALVPPIVPEALAYVIYTSGSTGVPNGVMVQHRSAVGLIRQAGELYRVSPECRVLQTASIGFDASVLEIFLALAHGASLLLVGEEERATPGVLGDLLLRQGVTTAVLTPSQLSVLPEPQLAGVRSLSVGGEACPADLALRWAAGRRLLNCYGPTEATVFATVEVCSTEREPGIGRPLPNVLAHVLDRGLSAVPLGVTGELVLGGAGVARGYLGRPQKTAERFVPDPFSTRPGARLYRTGDLARRRPGGELDFVGRADDQVKVRGFRIELGEIEATLLSHSGVEAAAVLAPVAAGGERRLVGYVVPRPGETVTAAELRGFLAERLPGYMVPARLVFLDGMPLTGSGKVDRRALPDPETARPDLVAAYVEPRDETERFVAGLWREVLGVQRVGAADNFFDLGGNSIKGAVLTNRLQERLGEHVYVVALFDAPTVTLLARHLERHYPTAIARVTGRHESAETPARKEPMASRNIDPSLLARFRSLSSGRSRSVKNPRAVFVLSPPRSGSTLLRVMLAGHPGLFAPPELELLGFTTLRERRETFSGRNGTWAEGTIRALMEIHGWTGEEARLRMEEYEARDLTVRELYLELQRSLGSRILVDKTPSYSLDLDVLRRAEDLFDEPLYIHLVRHPGGMVASFEEARLDQVFFHQEHDIPRRQLAELTWLTSQQNIREFLAGIPEERQTQIRYEDLVRRPEETLEQVCQLIGVDLDPGMLDPYEGSPRRMTDGIHPLSKMVGDVKFHQHSRIDPSLADRWRERLDEEELSEATRELASIFGYVEPATTPLAAPAPAWVPAWVPIAPVARAAENRLPLSFAQQRLWFFDQLVPGSPAYNLSSAVRIVGNLDIPALAGTLREIARRHEVLRTTFEANEGAAVQVISPEIRFQLSRINLSALTEEIGQREAERLARAEAQWSFDLAVGPLWRAALLTLAENEHLAVLTLHHIVTDGWSMGVLVQEIAAIYPALVRGDRPTLPPLPIQYGDFAVWQQSWLTGEILERHLGWWRTLLAGNPASLDLPFDRPRPAIQTFRGRHLATRFPAESSLGLKALGRSGEATTFMVLFAAFQGLLSRFSGQEDVVVGTPVFGRDRPEISGLIGVFVNTLALRGDLSRDPTFLMLLSGARRTILGAFAHQELPFERLVDELAPERSLAYSPLFQVMFALENLGGKGRALRLPGVTLEPVAEPLAEGSAKFDLGLVVAESPEGLLGAWDWNPDLFDTTTVKRLAEAFVRLVTGAVAHPEARLSELPLWSAAELHQGPRRLERSGRRAGAEAGRSRALCGAGRSAAGGGGPGLPGGALELRGARATRRTDRAPIGRSGGPAGRRRGALPGALGRLGHGSFRDLEGGRRLPAARTGPSCRAASSLDRGRQGARGPGTGRPGGGTAWAGRAMGGDGDSQGGDRRPEKRESGGLCRPGGRRLCDLHLGIDGASQGGRRRARAALSHAGGEPHRARLGGRGPHGRSGFLLFRHFSLRAPLPPRGGGEVRVGTARPRPRPRPVDGASAGPDAVPCGTRADAADRGSPRALGVAASGVAHALRGGRRGAGRPAGADARGLPGRGAAGAVRTD